MNNNSSGSTLLKILCVVGVLIVLVKISDATTPKCIKAGCDREQASGSSYCYLHMHRSTSSSRTSRSSGSSSSSKSSGTTSGSTSSSTTSGSKSSSSKSSSSKSSSSKGSSYDDGYESIYEDDDYDWNRYRTDSDYASGVDDAMDDLGW